MNVTCDKGCGEQFHIEQLGLDELLGEVERHWFHCPSCQAQYTAYYTNSGIRSLQEMLQKVTKRKRNPANVKLMKSLRERIRVGMKRLKSEIEG